MFQFNFDSALSGDEAANGKPARHDCSILSSREIPQQVAQADDAIDAALRCVPLPDGLLSRLGMIVRVMPDESAGQQDWLGC